MRHVVAVADKSDLQTIQTSFMFYERQTVRQHLTGMKQIGQPVDDRNRRVRGHFLQSRLGKSSDRDEIHPTAKAAGAIRGSFPGSQSDFRKAQKNGAAAYLGLPR